MRFTIVRYLDPWDDENEADVSWDTRVFRDGHRAPIAKFVNETSEREAEGFIAGLEYALGKIFVNRVVVRNA